MFSHCYHKMLIFGRNFDFLPKSRSLTKISIFYQNTDFWPKFRFFYQTLDFWPKFRFFTKMWMFDQNFDFWRRFRLLTKISPVVFFYGYQMLIWLENSISWKFDVILWIPARLRYLFQFYLFYFQFYFQLIFC